MDSVYVVGMHGMGDTLHERAIIKWLLKEGRDVWLETSWPQVFHDLVGPNLHLLRKESRLRTQSKNSQNNARLFESNRLFRPMPIRQISYSPIAVRSQKSVLKAMLMCSNVPESETDFRMPIKDEWKLNTVDWASIEKPIMVYRPLVERTEWAGCANRNPDHQSYADLFKSIRDRFFVVSIADLVPKFEWLVGEPVDVDLELHSGQLSFESLAVLVKTAALTFAAPGFATILAQAVGTPSVCVFGGYEDGNSFSTGAQWAPHLAIQPIEPCPCFSHTHKCSKAIDMPKALATLERFVNEIAPVSAIAA